jgi:hypothetical protein
MSPASDDPLAPILHEYPLPCSAEHAFTIYTAYISQWWDARYTANPETLLNIVIEPRVGGRVYATHTDLGAHTWGEVTVWEQGRRLAHTFTLAQDPAAPSTVTVEFVPDADAPKTEHLGALGADCTLRFAHGGWSAVNAAARAKFGDWPVLLERFVVLAQSRTYLAHICRGPAPAQEET